MGTEIIDPGPTGDSCVLCDNLLWPVGATPLWVKCHFSSIVNCPICSLDPPNGTWVLTQLPSDACWWQYDDGTYEINWHYESGEPTIWCMGDDGTKEWILFFKETDPCDVFAENYYQTCGASNIGAVKGEALIEIV